MITAVRHFSGAIFGLQSAHKQAMQTDLQEVTQKIQTTWGSKAPHCSFSDVPVQTISFPQDSFQIVRTGPDVKPALSEVALYQELPLEKVALMKQKSYTAKTAEDAIHFGTLMPHENGIKLYAPRQPLCELNTNFPL